MAWVQKQSAGSTENVSPGSEKQAEQGADFESKAQGGLGAIGSGGGDEGTEGGSPRIVPQSRGRSSIVEGSIDRPNKNPRSPHRTRRADRGRPGPTRAEAVEVDAQ